MNRCGYQIDDLDLSVRVYNLLLRAGITTVPNLGSLTDEELEKIKGLSAKGIQEIKEKLKRFDSLELTPCPFCGSTIKIVVCDDEGNIHTDDYEQDPWSGLGYLLYHDITDDCAESCPIAKHEGEGVMGTRIYDSKKEAIEAWNRRAEQ